jgi:hypothetical protein
VGSLQDADICMMFHAYLIHTELVPGGDVRDEVSFPAWVMHEAREAWMSNVRDDVTVSNWVKDAASIIGELGVPHVVERLTEDGYFSVDVYLPDDDIALEFDGPTHFMNTSVDVGGEGGAPGDAPRPRRGRCARSCATCFSRGATMRWFPCRGGAVQVDSIKTRVESVPGFSA